MRETKVGRRTFGECTAAFLRHCRSERCLAEKTVAAYASDLRWIGRRLGPRPRGDLNAIGRNEVLRVVEAAKSEFKPRTARRRLAVLRSFLRFHERLGTLGSSPLNRMDVRIRPPDTVPRCLPPDVVGAIMRQAERAGAADGYGGAVVSCVVNVLLFSGIRVSELVGLNMRDVRPDGSELLVLGKGSRERTVPIVDRVAAASVRRFLKSRASSFGEAAPDDPFFLGRSGKRLTDQSVRASLRAVAKSSGTAKRITPHMFRHTYASRLSGAGVDIRTIQLVLGHRSILTTQVYAHVSREDQRDLLRRARLRARLKERR